VWEHADLIARFPCLQRPRLTAGLSQPHHTDLAGKLLLDVASAGPLILTTGRGKGDVGQRSFKGYDGSKHTRVDHAMMSADLFESVVSVHLDDHCTISDHVPLCFTFPFASAGLGVGHGEGVDQGEVLRWDGSREGDYGRCIQSDQVGRAEVAAAISAGDVDGALSALLGIVTRAAHSTGMVRAPRVIQRRHPAGRRRPAWFDQQCREAKRQLRWAVKWGHARDQLVREYKNVTRRAKRSWEQLRALRLLDLIESKDPEAYRQVVQKAAKATTPVSAATWRQHLQGQFGAAEGVGSGGARSAVSQSVVPMDAQGVPVGVVALGRGRQQPQQAWRLPSKLELGQMVSHHITGMRIDSAAGLDSLPVPFVRNARVPVAGGPPENVLASLLCDMFDLCLRQGRIPESWKHARISPLHKKGDLHDPTNYRLLAVSSCLYRLYANVVRHIMTDWCVDNKKVPDTQFGFYPKRNTLQPMFILRHVVGAARHNGDRVFAAFIDFTQAYDRVDRSKLWAHLELNGMPAALMRVVRDMYSGDQYELVDGTKRSGLVQPVRGVKQGCPLSPLLFSLYLSDVVGAFPRECGAVIGPCAGAAEKALAQRVSHMMYADDLTLLANSQAHLQRLLSVLAHFAARKGLDVNVLKSQVVVFNEDPSLHTYTFDLGPARLERVPAFKYLGVVFDWRCCMFHATDNAARPFMAGVKRVTEMAEQQCVQDRPHAVLWLFQSFALSAGMYGCQIWSPGHVSEIMQRPSSSTAIHSRHAGFIKRVLGVKRSVTNMCALREAGQLPMHFYWFRAIARFWNSLLQACFNLPVSRCPILKEVVLGDVALAGQTNDCWVAQVHTAMTELGCAPIFTRPAVGEPHVRAVDLPTFLTALHARIGSAWDRVQGLDPRAAVLPQGCGRKLVTYANWMAVDWTRDPAKPRPPLPAYLGMSLSAHVRRDVARMRLSAHHLRVETGRWTGTDRQARICALCDAGVTQDERHVLFECDALAAIRAGRGAVLDLAGGEMQRLMTSDTPASAWFVSDCLRFAELMNEQLND
jgi:hypothetical protein